MRVTRRQLLASTALVAGAATTGAAALAWRWWDQPHAGPYIVLSEDEAAIVDAIAEACFPSGGEPAVGGGGIGVARYFDGILRGMPAEQQKLLKLATHAIDALPLPTHRTFFTELPVPAASAAMAAWLKHDRLEIRGLAQSFTVFVGMAWMAHPDVRRTLAPSFSCGFADAGGLPDLVGA